MDLVIIESPYKGNVKRNLRYLRSCIRDAVARGESPYASHRMLTDALDDGDPVERKVGIAAGLAWRKVLYENGPTSHEYVRHAFYVDLGWSDEMTIAKDTYETDRIPYEFRKLSPIDSFWKEEKEQEEELPTLQLLCALYSAAVDYQAAYEASLPRMGTSSPGLHEFSRERTAKEALFAATVAVTAKSPTQAPTRKLPYVKPELREIRTLGPRTREFLRFLVEERIAELHAGSAGRTVMEDEHRKALHEQLAAWQEALQELS